MLPTHAHIEPTKLCNLKCKSCTNRFVNQKGNMSLEQLRRILDTMPKLNDISLLGLGEPFANKNILHMAQEIKSRNITVRTVTNGTLLQSYDFEDILSSFHEIVISFDSTNKETFHDLRPGAEYDLVVDNIRKLSKLRKNHDTKLSLTTVISRVNADNVFDIIDFACQEGIEKVRFVSVRDIVGSDEVSDDLAEAAKMIEQMKLLDIRQKDSIVSYAHEKNIEAGYCDNTPTSSSCWWPHNGVFITYDGYVTPCCMRMDPGVICFGNVYKQSFDEIWNSEQYSEFRDKLKKGFVPEICKRCP